MKRLFSVMISVFLITLCISGCADNPKTAGGSDINLKNEYVEGRDNQYMYGDVWYGTPLQHSEEGYFYLRDGFLYFIDEETFDMYPLCNKSDCLHDKEKDETKKADCNAYTDCVAQLSEAKIQYYDGSLYYIYEYTDEDTQLTLRRFNIKSQNTEDVIKLDSVTVDDWIIHRGYFYYADTFMTDLDEEGNEYAEGNCALYRADLSSKNSAPEKISDFGEFGLSLQMTQNIHAYGNYVYYDTNTVKKGTDILDADNDTFEDKRYCYDIKNNKMIRLCDNTGGDSSSFFGFMNNKMLYISGTKSGARYVNSCDLDGKNPKKLFDFSDMPWSKGYSVVTDGKYIYFENIQGEKGKYYVLTADGEVINAVKLPFEINPHVSYDSKYIVQFAEESNDVKMIDKSKIASADELKAKSVYTFD